MSGNYSWRKLKKKDIPQAECLLRDMEDDCVSACGRFLEPSGGQVWKLDSKKEISALLINSRSTLIPVLCGMNEIPKLKFLKGFLREKKIHSVQGLKEDVLVIENEMEKTGRVIADIFDYDLMSLDSLPLENRKNSKYENLVLRTPQLIDLDAICSLQEGYEKEEVLPRGSTFSPASSRVNIAKIISDGKILAAQLNGRLIGKINVSAVSFTRYLVGGVYVHPDFRGLGIARRMAGEFIYSLISEGMGVTLFVKKNNTSARRLYLSLGFKKRGDYRITYY
jgi:ribosomal protein S18 acetylase RimI-like enzyme